MNHTNQTNGEPQFRLELKDMERVLEKMAKYYNGDPSHLTDVTAGWIVYENLESLYRALDNIHTDEQLVFFKDRFLKPQESGYRDIHSECRASKRSRWRNKA